jgi:hypothetical protein
MDDPDPKYLHVVAFNVPYPPDYGGIIDIYYKLKAISKEGVRIILHAFLYEREPANELEEICHQVHYYKRKSGISYFFNKLPYIVITRQSDELEHNLLNDPYPVLFEGLHTTLLLDRCVEAGKKVLVRTHNIEHKYYRMLAGSERNLFRKIFLASEARKLTHYEKILLKADKLLSISTTDAAYFNDKYRNSIRVSAFQMHEHVTASPGKGEYILFHGNLSVPENERALHYLVKYVLSRVTFHVVIAGKNPAGYVRRLCNKYPHIELIANPEGAEMDRLVAEAHINLLYTYQPTGLKLKLLHSLYGGKHCMANPLMLSGSGLESLCNIYRTPGEAVEMIEQLMKTPFEKEEILKRKEILREYNNAYNAGKIMSLLEDPQS